MEGEKTRERENRRGAEKMTADMVRNIHTSRKERGNIVGKMCERKDTGEGEGGGRRDRKNDQI